MTSSLHSYSRICAVYARRIGLGPPVTYGDLGWRAEGRLTLGPDQFFIPFHKRLIGRTTSPYSHPSGNRDDCEQFHHTNHQHRP